MKLIYLLHSGQLFGTERMALATLLELQATADPVILAPAGPIHAAAQALGVRTHVLSGTRSMATALWRELRSDRQAAVLATGVGQSLVASVVRLLARGQGPHLHVVHGGTDERLSYGRKRWLNGADIRFVAVSEFVRDRLLAHGVPADRIAVVHNFLHGRPPAERGPFTQDGVRRVVMLSRLDRIKRVGLLFDALDRTPALRDMHFDLYGSGELQAELAARAAHHPNVRLMGFQAQASAALADADLLLHTCPEEPFGLVMLEAFAAGVPVLAPNAGGAAIIVRPGVSGFHFTANNPAALGQALQALQTAPAALLQAMTDGGRAALRERFSPRQQAMRYAQLAGLTGLTGPAGLPA
jgi:glycosyltransferase involved in cell wall biosynthesis